MSSPAEKDRVARALRVLDAWVALEALSPQSYRRTQDLLTVSRSQIIQLGQGTLPWSSSLRVDAKLRVHHHVLLGEVLLAPAHQALTKRFTKEEQEAGPVAQQTPLAALVCNELGVPRWETLAISSFALALSVVLNGDLLDLKKIHETERRLITGLREQMEETDDAGQRLPLTHSALLAAHRWLVKELGLAAAFVREPTFFLREYIFRAIREAPEPLVLNGFFLGELERARALVASGKAPQALLRYLGVRAPSPEGDILRDRALFSALLSPERTPRGRWPGENRRPLVALQQAAVNAAMSSNAGDVIAVNGPPGTGKTTLLKDIVAAVVTQRAEVLAGFDDPAKAFVRTGTKISRAQAKVELRCIDKALRGFELVVASSNNKAVENVSAELPALGSIASDLPELRYFSSLASALRGQPSWGLVAAVLGNSANTRSFFEVFWDEEDRGLETYLAAAAGKPRTLSAPHLKGKTPRIIQEESPPLSHADALKRWRVARKQFAAVLKRNRASTRSFEKLVDAVAALSKARAALEALEAETDSNHDAELAEPLADVQSRFEEEREAAKDAETRLELLLRERPKLLARVLEKEGTSDFKAREKALRAELAEHRARAREAAETFERRQAEVQAAGMRREQAQAAMDEQRAVISAKTRELEKISKRIRTSEALWSEPHSERHRGAPWFDEEQHRLRDELFVAATKLHRAFIDAAAEPIRHNLSAFRQHLRRPLTAVTASEVRDLFSTFALVVPLFSTTFASVERMFRGLEPASLGWLLIDEGGQATPQAAVGAITRAQRVVIVGDPMQVEPVVTLPQSLVSSVCRHFEVSTLEFAAPVASAQTLADAASPYSTRFELREGARYVGLPLLVHRRCAEPMFGISNAVAYGDLMVQATPTRPSPIGEVLRESCWYHVDGEAEGHWCPAEGEVLVRMLRRLRQHGLGDDLYVISPFREVAFRARTLVGQTPDLRDFSVERIGTIHTVQGREAEAVILLLGANEPAQQGARRWAGSRPNLLNVAVTRAKERLYVVGNHEAWSGEGCFALLAESLPRKNIGGPRRG